MLPEDGAGEDRVIASLPAKVDLTRELVPTPNVGDLSLDHDRPQVEELWESQTPCRQTDGGRGEGEEREQALLPFFTNVLLF